MSKADDAVSVRFCETVSVPIPAATPLAPGAMVALLVVAPDMVPLPCNVPPDNVTLVVPTNVVFDKAEPEVVARFDEALDRLATAGARIERRAIPAFDAVLELGARHGALVTAEAYALHARHGKPGESITSQGLPLICGISRSKRWGLSGS